VDSLHTHTHTLSVSIRWMVSRQARDGFRESWRNTMPKCLVHIASEPFSPPELSRLGVTSRDTAGYMAPEIRKKECRKRRVTPLHSSIDVYAMGVTLLELFAGSVWMCGSESDAQVDLEVEQALERVERVEPAVAPIIRSCLATRPAGAYPGRRQPSSRRRHKRVDLHGVSDYTSVWKRNAPVRRTHSSGRRV